MLKRRLEHERKCLSKSYNETYDKRKHKVQNAPDYADDVEGLSKLDLLLCLCNRHVYCNNSHDKCRNRERRTAYYKTDNRPNEHTYVKTCLLGLFCRYGLSNSHGSFNSNGLFNYCRLFYCFGSSFALYSIATVSAELLILSKLRNFYKMP